MRFRVGGERKLRAVALAEPEPALFDREGYVDQGEDGPVVGVVDGVGVTLHAIEDFERKPDPLDP